MNDPLLLVDEQAEYSASLSEGAERTGDMTPEEAIDAIEDYRYQCAKKDEYMAHRRRSIGRMNARRAWKALGHPTPEDFAQKRLGLGKAAYWKAIQYAEAEHEIVSKILDFEKENVKDSFLAALLPYYEKDRIRIVKHLVKTRVFFKGKTVTEAAKTLGILPKPDTRKPAEGMDGLRCHDDSADVPCGVNLTVYLNVEERDLAYRLAKAQGLTPDVFMRFLLHQAEQSSTKEKVHREESLCTSSSEQSDERDAEQTGSSSISESSSDCNNGTSQRTPKSNPGVAMETSERTIEDTPDPFAERGRVDDWPDGVEDEPLSITAETIIRPGDIVCQKDRRYPRRIVDPDAGMDRITYQWLDNPQSGSTVFAADRKTFNGLHLFRQRGGDS